MSDPTTPRCTCGAGKWPSAQRKHLPNCDLEIMKPTGPLIPGQVKCINCQENERSRAASSPVDGLCTFCRDSGDARRGHQFHFQVMVQGSHRSPDGLYRDEPEPVEYEPFRLTVRAWNLAAACRKAAETPMAEWEPFREEQG